MAIKWEYNASDYEERDFRPIPIGDHRVRILNAEELTSRNGNDMIKLTMDVSGYASYLWHYIVITPDNPQMVNRKLGEIFDSFDIKQGNMDIESWIGRVGAARVKHDSYNGETQARVSYFISRDKQDKLPAWKEAENSSSTMSDSGMTQVITDEDLPF